jgi:hypothetical protein
MRRCLKRILNRTAILQRAAHPVDNPERTITLIEV